MVLPRESTISVLLLRAQRKIMMDNFPAPNFLQSISSDITIVCPDYLFWSTEVDNIGSCVIWQSEDICRSIFSLFMSVTLLFE